MFKLSQKRDLIMRAVLASIRFHALRYPIAVVQVLLEVAVDWLNKVALKNAVTSVAADIKLRDYMESHKNMKILTIQVFGAGIKVECPHCGAEIEGFVADPRGAVGVECDECKEAFDVDSDAEVIIL